MRSRVSSTEGLGIIYRLTGEVGGGGGKYVEVLGVITWFSGVTEGGINTRQKRMKGALQETEWRDHKNVTEPHRGG